MTFRINALVVLIFVLSTMTVICHGSSCSIGNMPKTIGLSSLNNTESINKYPVLLLSQTESTCNRSVKNWRFCYTINGSSAVAEQRTPNLISFGVWRPNDSNFYALVSGNLEPLPVSETYFQFDFLCQRFSTTPVDVLEGDVLGVVLHNEPTVFSVLGANVNQSHNICVGPIMDNDYQLVNRSNLNCSHYGYQLFLHSLIGNDLVNVPHSTTPVDENSNNTGTQLWVYIVLGVLSLLLAVSIFVTIVMLVQIHRQKQHKEVVVATDKRSTVDLCLHQSLENGHHEVPSYVTNPASANSSASGNTESYPSDISNQEPEVFDEDSFSPISQRMFSYPPPASKAPSPPVETSQSINDRSNPEPPLIVSGIHDEHEEVAKEHGIEENSVPHYPLNVSKSLSIEGGTLSEATGVCDHSSSGTSSKNVFEVERHTDASASPIPVPRKSASFKAASCEEKPIKLPRRSPKSQIPVDNVEQDPVNGRSKARKTTHQYVNVKSKLGRMNSAPSASSSPPVYAEPTPSNQRTRFLSYNQASARTPPLSNIRKTSSRQRSISGGELTNPGSNVSTHAFSKSMDCIENSKNSLEKIVETDEVIHDRMPTVTDKTVRPPPGDYLEPVLQKNKKT